MIRLGERYYLTARELAAKLGVSKSYVCRMARREKLPGAQKTELGWIFPETVMHEWEKKEDG